MTLCNIQEVRSLYRIDCDYVHKGYHCDEKSPAFPESRYLLMWVLGSRWTTIGSWHLCHEHSKPTYKTEVRWMHDDAKETPEWPSNDEQNPTSNTASGAHSHPQGTPA